MSADSLDLSQKGKEVEKFLLQLQAEICQELEKLDKGQKFIKDRWNYVESGGGITRVLEQGAVFEKAGVNFSSIEGAKLPSAGSKRDSNLSNRPFGAMGISVVIHPRNPYVPTTHMNLRFIQVDQKYWWFGGGFDLTPYYPFLEDVIHWHQMAATACKGFGNGLYQKLKQWCDQYFYIKHRNETRGIGGLFFDDYTEAGFEASFEFVQSVGKYFLEAYLPIVEKRMNHSYGNKERNFQLMRRGRYVEFNLVYDRGTLFGLQSQGRIESILMSLPPKVIWSYDWQAEPGSQEQQLIDYYLRPRDWLAAS